MLTELSGVNIPRCFLLGMLALGGLGGGAVQIRSDSSLAHRLKYSFRRISCPDG